MAAPHVGVERPRRSARLALTEAPQFISILDKAAHRKKLKMEGAKKMDAPGALPAELLELANDEPGPWPLTDLKAMGRACEITDDDLASLDATPRVPSSSHA